MLAKILIGQMTKLAIKGLVSEKLIKKIVLLFGDLLVKSSKNKLDDKVWKQVRKLLEK